MENKKDIGKAFREKLDSLQKTAPDGGWDSISSQLRQIKKPYKFPWTVTVISLTVVVVIFFATYPLWENHRPRVLIEIPENNKSDNTTDVPPSEQHENDAPAGRDMEGYSEMYADSVKTGKASSKSPLPDKRHPASISSETIVTTDKKPDTAESNDNPGTNSKTLVPAPGDSMAVSSVKENLVPITETNTGEEVIRTDNSELTDIKRGKLRPSTDYGADSLVIIKKTEKRDISKIADSLNKLYGRDRKKEKKKKS